MELSWVASPDLSRKRCRLHRGRDHRYRLVPAILQTDPADWLASPPLCADADADVDADAEILEVLQNTRPLATDELVSLTVWVGRRDINLLHSLKLGSDAPEAARRVWEEEPRAFVSSAYYFAIQLAEVGTLMEWRERLTEAEVVWRQHLDDWETRPYV